MKFLIAALVLICGSVSAQTYQAGDLTLTDAFSYPTTGRSGAGYFTLTNDGAADALLDVEADYPKVMLHKSNDERWCHDDGASNARGGAAPRAKSNSLLAVIMSCSWGLKRGGVSATT